MEDSSLARPLPFTYHDYREFLRDHLSYLRSQKKVSMRLLNANAGLSHGYLSLVISNQRNLTTKALGKLMPFLELQPEEGEYLGRLLTLADAPTAQEKNQAFEGLKASQDYQKHHPQEFQTYQYLQNWTHVVIRELSLTKNFQLDTKWIQKQIPFSVSLKEISDSLEFLMQNGFLQVQKNGEIRAVDRPLQCVGGVFQLSLANFHNSMLQLARESLSRFRKENRKQIGYTMALSKSDFESVKQILEEAKEKLKAVEAASTNKDTVYHVNFSAFPVAGEGCHEE